MGGGLLALKMQALCSRLRGLGELVIAFSGGTDSALLACVAGRELAGRVLLVTAHGSIYPEWELREALDLAKSFRLRHLIIPVRVLSLPRFAANPVNRCYYCKRALFRQIKIIAGKHGMAHIADGTNADDAAEYRAGQRAALELGVVSPLLEVGLTKAEIRRASRQLGLPTFDKPAMACLASRIPCGEKITSAKLNAIARMEDALRQMGFRQARVRHHGALCRIEAEETAMERLAAPRLRKKITRLAKRCGFVYITLDLEGYRTGSVARRIN